MENTNKATQSKAPKKDSKSTASQVESSKYDVNIADIVNEEVKSNDPRFTIKPKGHVKGLPKVLRLESSKRSFYTPTYIDPNTKREVRDTDHPDYSRVTRLTFVAKNYDALSTYKKLLDSQVISQDDYGNMVGTLPRLTIAIDGEDTVKQFMNDHSDVLDGLEHGTNEYDVSGVEYAFTTTYTSFGREPLALIFDSVDGLNFKEIDNPNA